jgi:Tol biopolymer transport system component
MPRLGGTAEPIDSGAALVDGPGRTIIARGDTTLIRAEDGRETVLWVGLRELHSFAWRPDGRMVAWVRGNQDYNYSWGNISPSQVWVAPLGGTAVAVTDSTSLNTQPAWLPNGTLLFISNRDGARDIYALRIAEDGRPIGTPLRLTTGLEPFSVSPSADGRTLAYDRLLLRRNLYALPIPTSGVASMKDAVPLTTGNQTIETLSVTRDGRTLIFDSNLKGRQDLYVMSTAGGEVRRVTRGGTDNFSPDPSPDNREIAFHTIRNTTRDIYVVGIDGSGERALVDDGAESFHPAYSPDGLTIAYSDLATTSTTRVIRRKSLDAEWGPPETLPIPNGFGPRWSPDGRYIAYFTHARPGGIGIYELGGTARQLMPPDTFGLEYPSWPEWSADSRSIYFRAFDADDAEGLYQVDLAGGRPRLLIRFDDPTRTVFLGAIPHDGKRFYFAAGELESDIYLMDLVTK